MARDVSVRRRRAALVIAVVAVLVGGATKLATEVRERETLGFDDTILKAMRDDHGDPIGPSWFQRTMIDLSALGSTSVATLVVVVASVSLLLAGRRRHGLLVAACAIGTGVAIQALKALVGRERPEVIHALDAPGGYSFPSGHTLTVAAIYPLIAYVIAHAQPERRLRALVYAVATLVVLVVGFTRVYLGVHYPTDVIAGWSLGLAWAIACGFVGTRLVSRESVESPQVAKP